MIPGISLYVEHRGYGQLLQKNNVEDIEVQEEQRVVRERKRSNNGDIITKRKAKVK